MKLRWPMLNSAPNEALQSTAPRLRLVVGRRICIGALAMDDTSVKVSAEDEIRDFIVRMSAYAGEKNVDGLMSLYHPDAASFEFASQTAIGSSERHPQDL